MFKQCHDTLQRGRGRAGVHVPQARPGRRRHGGRGCSQGGVKGGAMTPQELLAKWRADMDTEEMEATIILLDQMRRGLIERVAERRAAAIEPEVRCWHRRRRGGGSRI